MPGICRVFRSQSYEVALSFLLKAPSGFPWILWWWWYDIAERHLSRVVVASREVGSAVRCGVDGTGDVVAALLAWPGSPQYVRFCRAGGWVFWLV